MFPVPDLIQHAYAVLSNITTTIPIPVQIIPGLGGTVASSSSSNTANSVLTDGSLAGVLGSLGVGVYSYIKNKMDDSKQYDRTAAVVNTQQSTVNSLKASDVAAKEDAIGLSVLVTTLCKDDNLSKLLNEPTDMGVGLKGMSVVDYIKQQAQEWDESNQQYYHNSNPVPGDTSKDPIIQKTADISKMTVPSPQ